MLTRQVLLNETTFAKFQVDFPSLNVIFKSSSVFESLFGYSAILLGDFPMKKITS